MDQGYHVKREKHPRENANVFSLITFAYMVKLFFKGCKKDLVEDDVYEVTKNLKSEDLGNRIEQEWKIEKFNHKTPSVLRLLLTCYGKKYLLLGVIQFVIETILNILNPIAMGKLVLYFTPGQTELTPNQGYFYGILLLSLYLFSSFYYEHYILAKSELGIQIRNAISSLIYRKSLKLSPKVLNDELSTGKIITIMTKDVHSVDMAINLGNEFWIETIQGVFLCYLIYNKVGIAAIVCVASCLATFPLHMCVGNLVFRKRIVSNKKSDERLQLTQEILLYIRIIKMYTWEKFFCNKTHEARKKEINELQKLFFLKESGFMFGSLVGRLSYYLVIMIYFWMGNNLSAEVVYYVGSCYGRFELILAYILPIGLAECADFFASIKRIDTFLKADEIQTISTNKHRFMQAKILLRDVKVNITHNNGLSDVSINFEKGLNIILGTVGSGKTTLIKTILREYKPSHGNVFINGEISYASQQSWLFPSTIRQNILFGLPYEEERYQKVIEVCALKLDLDMFAKNDLTIIGDCGTNLSKGQQARINLARAIYRDVDIYLLDDCLSALDNNVQNFIFKNCIQNFLKNKLVVFVTHNNSFLKKADQIGILKNNTIAYSGSFNDVYIKNYYNERECDSSDISNEQIFAEKHTIIDNLDKDNLTTPVNCYQEINKEGSVNWIVYKRYILFGGAFLFGFVFLLHLCVEGVHMYGQKLISEWVNHFPNNISNMTVEEKNESIEKTNAMMLIIVVIISTTIIARLAKCLLHFAFAFTASRNAHKTLLNNVVRAEIQFFDKYMVGNILNRFSKDLGQMDEQITFVLHDTIRALLVSISTIILIVTVSYLFLISAIVLLILFISFTIFYIPTGRSLKRLDAATRSAIIGHLNSSLEGLATVRAFKTEEILKKEFDNHQDLYISAQYMVLTSTRAVSMILDLMCCIFMGVILTKLFFFNTGSLAGDVGLAISNSLQLWMYLQSSVQNYITLESYMTSVERLLEYVDYPQEQTSGKSLKDWPSKAIVSFKNVNLTYTLNNEQILKNISFEVQPMEKLGIVGRTGAGKSSIIVALYRLYQTQGDIFIDKEEIKDVELECLRSSISIIPQEPVIFAGTVRTNLDPFNKLLDKEIWNALDEVGLKDTISNLEVDIKQLNFSLGQKQLISIARAIVRKNRILVLDEATANMDVETEKSIHKKIKDIFVDCTIIIVAHRMETIIDCDKVVVMDKGRVLEFDTPQNLIANESSTFCSMVRRAGAMRRQAE